MVVVGDGGGRLCLSHFSSHPCSEVGGDRGGERAGGRGVANTGFVVFDFSSFELLGDVIFFFLLGEGR